MAKDLVSILIPAYNVEDYIEDCLKSVIKQSYENTEIIIINDGSTDRTLDICKKYRTKDKRIVIINKKNGGVSEARNVAQSKCNGNYIAFVDADDVIDSGYVGRLMDAIVDNNADIACCGYKKFKNISATTKKNRYYSHQIKIFNNIEALESLLYQKELDTSLWDKIIKKSCFRGIKFNDVKIFEDLDVMYKIFGNSKKIVYVDDELYYYRIRPESLTNKKISEDNLKVLDIVLNMKKNIVKKYPSLEGACNSRLLAVYFYFIRKNNKKDDLYKECVAKIKELRKIVEKDEKISRRTKIGILISKINIDLINIQNHLRVK